MDSDNVKFEVQNRYSIEDFKDYWIGFRLKSPGKAPPEQVSSHSMRLLFWFLIFAGVVVEIAYLCLHTAIDMPYAKLYKGRKQTVKRAADNKRRYAPGEGSIPPVLLSGVSKGVPPLAHDFACKV